MREPFPNEKDILLKKLKGESKKNDRKLRTDVHHKYLYKILKNVAE